ncbi:MAG: anti-sigma F factor [Clostridia bacterium]|nr:anti-sigma F factor [Clostridia bacterium]
MDNFMRIDFLSKSANEGFARMAVSAFISQLDPTIDAVAEIKTAVSEAVTNAIVHGYEGVTGYVTLTCGWKEKIVTVTVEDKGRGISDIAMARTPLFTTKPEHERSGMGFTVMENFMDSVEVYSKPMEGTKVVMIKKL